MQSIHVFEVDLNLLGTDDLYNKIHFLGYNVFQVSHLAMEYIYDEDSDFQSNSPVEIGAIRKVVGIQNIVNPFFSMDMMEEQQHEDGEDISENGYNPNLPFKLMENINGKDERIMKFKHSCGEEISCVNFDWPYIMCSNKVCNKKILRKDIEFVGGIYLFVGE